MIDEDVLADLRELDMGEPGVLQSFIDGVRRAVPEHVALCTKPSPSAASRTLCSMRDFLRTDPTQTSPLSQPPVTRSTRGLLNGSLRKSDFRYFRPVSRCR